MSPLIVPIQSKINPVHTFSLYFLKINSNIIFLTQTETQMECPNFGINARVSGFSWQIQYFVTSVFKIQFHSGIGWQRIQVCAVHI